MNYQRNNVRAWTIIIVLILICALSVFCDPSIQITVENQTKYVLTISIESYSKENVKPGEQITRRAYINARSYNIEAKNDQGEVVFSEELMKDQMQKISSLKYKVIIK